MEHLPECKTESVQVPCPDAKPGCCVLHYEQRRVRCICKELRECEQRVREDDRRLRIADGYNGIGHWIDCPVKRHDATAIYQAGYSDGLNDRSEANARAYAVGVQAARDAVESLEPRYDGEWRIRYTDALAAIDKLIGPKIIHKANIQEITVLFTARFSKIRAVQ